MSSGELTQAELAELFRRVAPGQQYLGDAPERWLRDVLIRQLRVRLAEHPNVPHYAELPHSPALAEVKALYAGVCAGTVEIDADLAAGWVVASAAAHIALDQMAAAEIPLRIEIGYSQTGTLAGKPVVRRAPGDLLERLV